MAQREKKHIIRKKGPAARSRRYEIHNILNTHTDYLVWNCVCVSVFDPFANRERERGPKWLSFEAIGIFWLDIQNPLDWWGWIFLTSIRPCQLKETPNKLQYFFLTLNAPSWVHFASGVSQHNEMGHTNLKHNKGTVSRNIIIIKKKGNRKWPNVSWAIIAIYASIIRFCNNGCVPHVAKWMKVIYKKTISLSTN